MNAMLVLAVVCAMPADGFTVTTKNPNDRVTFTVENGVTIVDIQSPFGISEATIERKGESWPKAMTLRLHLSALEGFHAKCGQAGIDGHAPSLKLTINGKVIPQDAKKPAELAIRAIGRDEKESTEKPLKEGYFEIRLPNKFFEGNPKSFTMRWVDWYRR